MSSDQDLTIRFWGVRGSIATADEDKVGFGGNTPCVSVQVGQEPPIILDAGTGIRLLGQSLCRATTTGVEAAIFFSHFHWDHIQGFPFFQPLYDKASRLALFSAFQPGRLKAALSGQMQSPYFPVPFSAIQAQTQYGQVESQGVQVGSLCIRPIRLNHPGGCSGFRVDSQAKSLVYITDHEHGDAELDAEIGQMAMGTNVLIYDAHFSPAEYRTHRGWGHSTWLEGTKMARRAGAERLVLFHYSPTATDKEIERTIKLARREFAFTEASRETQPIVLLDDATLLVSKVCER